MEGGAAGSGGYRASCIIVTLGISMPSEKNLRVKRPAIRFPRTPFHSLLTLLAITQQEGLLRRSRPA
jgi:hypothetical protein